MDHYCPICKQQLEKDSESVRTEFNCKPWSRDHHYSKLIENNEIIRMKIRLTDDSSQIYLHVNVQENYSEVWTQPNDIIGRIRIHKAIVPDFSNVTSLRSKLQTYLLLS